MRMLFFTLITLAMLGSASAQDYVVRTEKAAPPKELAAGIAELLDDQSLQVQSDKGAAVATIWLRRKLPSKATTEQVKSGLTYRELQQTTLVGVVHFSQGWADFRNQKIPAGIYTLRFAIQPQDGDHMGTAPYNEFCLLIPAAKDTKPGTFEVKDLHELSANAPGGTHPGVMLLFPNSKPGAEPKIESRRNGIHVLLAKTSVEAGSEMTTLGFGFVIAGHAKE